MDLGSGTAATRNAGYASPAPAHHAGRQPELSIPVKSEDPLFRIRVRPCGEGIVDTAGAGDLQTHHIQRDVRGLIEQAVQRLDGRRLVGTAVLCRSGTLSRRQSPAARWTRSRAETWGRCCPCREVAPNKDGVLHQIGRKKWDCSDPVGARRARGGAHLGLRSVFRC